MITYVDASVLLRVILGESGRLEQWGEITPVSSELIRVESLRVIDRARVAFDLDDATISGRRADVLEALRTFTLVPITSAVLERAADPFPTSLGSLDAIHLATAIALRGDLPDLAVATHDAELATAARAVGFEVQGA